jgi:hypothetical protein
MKLFEYILSESLHTKTREAKDILMASGMAEKEAHALALKIEDGDPYKDAGRLFTPVVANWIVKGIMNSHDEHMYDIEKYKENRKKLKGSEVTIVNLKKKKDLLSKKPEDFMHHYSHLQEWNTQCESLLDDGKGDNSAKEIEVAKHNGYTMYKIDKKEHLDIPLVKNKMKWCVTKRHFGSYSGPPYYAIMRDSDSSPFAMIIPNHMKREIEQAVRDGANEDMLSDGDAKKIVPLLKMVLPQSKNSSWFVEKLHMGVDKVRHPYEAIDMLRIREFSNDEIEKLEDVISINGQISMEYAEYHLGPGKRFEKGEDAIARNQWSSLRYAKHLGPGKRFEKGEDAIAKDPFYSLLYAQHLGPRKRFEKGEDVISRSAHDSLEYAKHLGPGKRFRLGEEEMSKSSSCSLEYAKHLGPGKRFVLGERVISKNEHYSLDYTMHIGKRFKLAEAILFRFKSYWEEYLSILESLGVKTPDKPWRERK